MIVGALLGLGPAAALGVGRFAYALVLPEMQRALGLSYAQAGLLGSANTLGYFVGALVSHRLLYAVGYRRGFYAALALQAFALALLALGTSFGALLALRLVQGVLGAWVFVGGAALVLASTPRRSSRGLATGLYFGGVGVGIALSPLAMLAALPWRETWALLGGLSLLLGGAATAPVRALQEPAPRTVGASGSLRPIAPLLAAYGLYGAGYIGYMTFVTTALGVPLAPFWALLGLSASCTGLMWGRWIDRVGGGAGMTHVLLVLTLASLYPVLTAWPWVSAFAFGVSFLGVITAVTAAFSKLLPPGAWAGAMGVSTAVFALGQALGPSVSGFAGDRLGGPVGALGFSTALLGAALLAAWLQAVWPPVKR
ncbi:YbfB/YjiJ family MFS transporter [Truepera radiovictrix]|uniref:YbfB/YjiJ family MFS transporter n=1 Tax=Truepera radiovictrix TaxID=332249 RepID=UPI0005A5458A|nr:YbfB/YjiJ family MFS transporter [Truepera radiovictrix]WMT56391.1 YbfB/YjiJ family MFS transporter [Truepera radiovictrix]